MRVLFINHANDDILTETSSSLTHDEISNNCIESEYLEINNITKCLSLGKFLKENDFMINSIYSPNDPKCLKTAKFISDVFGEAIEKFVNLEISDYKQDKTISSSVILDDTIKNFKFCEMNSIENCEKFKNINNKFEWYFLSFYFP